MLHAIRLLSPNGLRFVINNWANTGMRAEANTFQLLTTVITTAPTHYYTHALPSRSFNANDAKQGLPRLAHDPPLKALIRPTVSLTRDEMLGQTEKHQWQYCWCQPQRCTGVVTIWYRHSHSGCHCRRRGVISSSPWSRCQWQLGTLISLNTCCWRAVITALRRVFFGRKSQLSSRQRLRITLGWGRFDVVFVVEITENTGKILHKYKLRLCLLWQNSRKPIDHY